jgi:hypothetical protein
MWGSSPEIPKTGSPLAKGELAEIICSTKNKCPPYSKTAQEERKKASKSQCSGFHLEVELTSRDGGAPPARGAREAVGGAGHIVTTIRHKPFSEFNNVISSQSQGYGGFR